jgi:NAD(P)-dependent dehydrogenase (short-subunit alcohol dehydrogenase family)
MSSRFEGKTAIVTGSTSGIGRAVALALGREGAQVVVSGRRAEKGEAVVADIRAAGGKAIFVRTDVGSMESVANLVAQTLRAYGELHLAFNNAGIPGDVLTPAAEQSEASWDAVLEINLKGVWRCMKHEIPAMLKVGGGVIVNNSSDAGLAGSDLGISAYVASKHGVVGLTRAAAIEYARKGIRINAVCPGITYSEMIEPGLANRSAFDAYVDSHVPMGRIADAEEIASAVLWLLSGESSFVTGQAVAIDGGTRAK